MVCGCVIFSAEVHYESMNNLAMVFHNGHVYYAPKARIRTRCSIDMTKFPYDEQKCMIQFGSFTYDGDRLKLELFPVRRVSCLLIFFFLLNRQLIFMFSYHVIIA